MPSYDYDGYKELMRNMALFYCVLIVFDFGVQVMFSHASGMATHYTEAQCIHMRKHI